MLARPKLPNAAGDTDRLVIVGTTGTGKTVAGVSWLAERSYNIMPWIIANYKNDELLNQIPLTREIGPLDKIPDAPGLYMVRPECEEGSLDPLLLKAHKRGGYVGFYIDEGYEVGQNSKALRRVLSQGRSMRIPCIILSQRPVWLNKFAFSEAQMFQFFRLGAITDRKAVVDWLPDMLEIPKGVEVDVNYPSILDEYQSIYFDAKMNVAVRMGPVKTGNDILNVFERRLPRQHKKLG